MEPQALWALWTLQALTGAIASANYAHFVGLIHDSWIMKALVHVGIMSMAVAMIPNE